MIGKQIYNFIITFSDQPLYGGNGQEILQLSISEEVHTRTENKACSGSDIIHSVQDPEDKALVDRLF